MLLPSRLSRCGAEYAAAPAAPGRRSGGRPDGRACAAAAPRCRCPLPPHDSKGKLKGAAERGCL